MESKNCVVPAGIPRTRFHFKTRSVEVWPRREKQSLPGILRPAYEHINSAVSYNILGETGSIACITNGGSGECRYMLLARVAFTSRATNEQSTELYFLGISEVPGT